MEMIKDNVCSTNLHKYEKLDSKIISKFYLKLEFIGIF